MRQSSYTTILWQTIGQRAIAFITAFAIFYSQLSVSYAMMEREERGSSSSSCKIVKTLPSSQAGRNEDLRLPLQANMQASFLSQPDRAPNASHYYLAEQAWVPHATVENIVKIHASSFKKSR